MRVRVVAVAVVAGVTAAGVALASADPDGRAGSRSFRSEPVPVVVPFQADDVSRLVLEAVPVRAELSQPVPGAWQPGAGTAAASAEMLTVWADELFPLRAYRALASDADRPEFGFGAPALVVRLADRRNREVMLTVGGPAFNGGGSYARRQGDPRVFLLTRRAVDGLRSVLSGDTVETPRPANESQALAGVDRLSDPEIVTNPWLSQVIEEMGEDQP